MSTDQRSHRNRDGVMTQVAPGIFKTKTGFRAYVRVRDAAHRSKYRTKTKRFPKTTKVSEIKQWREAERVKARATRPHVPLSGTLAQDIERYLDQVAAMPSLADRRRQLHAWREVLGDVARSAITAAMIRAQLQAWRSAGPLTIYNPRAKTYRRIARPLSASACNHRRTALLHLYRLLDGAEAPNPVRSVKPFVEPPPEPRARDLGFLEAAIGRMRNAQQRARALVLLWTGMRGNSELGKMRREYVDLEAAVCQVPTGKGGRRFRTVPLNAKGLDAWRAFIAAKAFGEYDKNYLRRSIAAACRAEAKARDIELPRIRAYDLRHSWASAVLKAGADLADVQELLGHTSPRMTRRYAPFSIEKVRGIIRAL